MPYELLYTSEARRHFSENELSTLLVEFREANKKVGLTGLLVFNGLHFMQLLEGSKKEIDALFEKICGDERHSNVKLFRTGAIEHRSFARWDMAYGQLPADHDLEAWVNQTVVDDVLNANTRPETMGRRIFRLLYDLQQASALERSDLFITTPPPASGASLTIGE